LAYERALSLGAEPAGIPAAQKALDVPAIKGIGGSLLYFVDHYGAKGSAYDAEFEWTGAKDPRPEGAGLHYIDHLTHNVHRGRMDVWTGFYEKLFNFRQIRFFDIEGRASGLFSRALTSPDGKIRIPINEDAGGSGQIEEYLSVYRGEGISTSPADRGISTRPSRGCGPTACRSCRRRATPISRRSMRGCPSMARTSPG
jgi:4-hydroxyphenylpyruvate dioxygenase